MRRTTYIYLILIFIFSSPVLKSQTETDTIVDVASQVEATPVIDKNEAISILDTTRQQTYTVTNENGTLLIKDSPIVRALDSLLMPNFTGMSGSRWTQRPPVLISNPAKFRPGPTRCTNSA